MKLNMGKTLTFPLQSTEKEYKSTRNPLHNFTSLSKELNWGSQYLVKFAKSKEIKCVTKPWNLRGTVNLEASGSGLSCERMKRRSPPVKSLEKTRLLLSLSNEEIEHDFMILTGRKPEKIPKSMKRDREAQRKLDKLVPGLCLTQIVPEKFIVADVREQRKGKLMVAV